MYVIELCFENTAGYAIINDLIFEKKCSYLLIYNMCIYNYYSSVFFKQIEHIRKKIFVNPITSRFLSLNYINECNSSRTIISKRKRQKYIK